MGEEVMTLLTTSQPNVDRLHPLFSCSFLTTVQIFNLLSVAYFVYIILMFYIYVMLY